MSKKPTGVRALESYAEAKAQLAEIFHNEAFRQLETHINAGKDQVLKNLWADYSEARRDSIAQRLASVQDYPSPATAGQTQIRANAKPKKRKRRSADDLKADAEQVVAMIKKAGEIASGDLAKQIKQAGIKVTGTVKAWVKEHAGVTLHTTGARVNMKYSVK